MTLMMMITEGKKLRPDIADGSYDSNMLTKATRVAIFIGDTRTTVKIPNPKYQLHRPPR